VYARGEGGMVDSVHTVYWRCRVFILQNKKHAQLKCSLRSVVSHASRISVENLSVVYF
jgi:hypothetical protein